MLLYEVANPVKTQTMFSVDRISRQGDKFLGRLRMDAETLQSLRQDNVGLLFEKFLSLETMLGRITRLAVTHDLGRIAIVYSSATAGAHLYQLLCDEGLCSHQKRPPVTWEVGSLVFTSVESLAKLAWLTNEPSISTVVLLDSTCMVSKARTLQLGNGRTHDHADHRQRTVRSSNRWFAATVYAHDLQTCDFPTQRATGTRLSPRDMVVLRRTINFGAKLLILRIRTQFTLKFLRTRGESLESDTIHQPKRPSYGVALQGITNDHSHRN